MPESPPGLTPGHDRLRLYCLDCFRYWVISRHDGAAAKCPLYPPKTDVDRIAHRRRTWLNSDRHQLGWLLVFNSKFLRVNEDHRSANASRQTFDYPHPGGVSRFWSAKWTSAARRVASALGPGADNSSSITPDTGLAPVSGTWWHELKRTRNGAASPTVRRWPSGQKRHTCR